MLRCLNVSNNKQLTNKEHKQLIHTLPLLHISTEHFSSKEKERMSPVNWPNNIGECGEDDIVFLYVEEKVEIYKKAKGWDNETLWLKFGRKDGVFQWLKSEIDPGYVESSMGLISRAPIFQKEDSLYWNFILRDSEPCEEWPWQEKIDVKFFSGPWHHLTFQLHISWDGEGFRYGSTNEYFSDHREFTYEFYSNSFPLKELPNSTLVIEPVEGWTCLDESEDYVKDEVDDEQDDEQDEEEDEEEEDEDDEGGRFITGEEEHLITTSVYALFQENKRLKEELETKNLMIQQLTEETSSESGCSEGSCDSDDYDDAQDYDEYAEEIYEERRIDPFDEEMYTKEEFLDYYGYDGFGDAMWEMNDPEKISKILMYEWVLSRNSEVLNTKNRNYIMDKMVDMLF